MPRWRGSTSCWRPCRRHRPSRIAPPPQARPDGGPARSRTHAGGGRGGRGAQRRRPAATLCRGGLRRRIALSAAARGRAREAYERVLAQSPKDVKARYGKFYASVEMEDFTTAYATIDDLVGDEPIWRTYKETPAATITREGVRRSHGGAGPLLRQSARRGVGPHHKISDAAPANSNGRYAVYQIAKARGWPQRAEAEAQIAVSLAPDTSGRRSPSSRWRWPTTASPKRSA